MIIFTHLSTDFAMTALENITKEFYETLLHLKYPGIAQATPEDMELTILGSENRIFLLSWLLAQSPVIPSEEFSSNTDTAKLVKWYSNMGICTNADALLGKVSIQDQIPSLRNLLLFMKNVLIVEQTNFFEEPSVVDILKKHIGETVNIIPPTCSLTSKLNYNEAMRYLKTRRRSLSEKRNSTQDIPAAIQKSQSTNDICGAHGNNISESCQEHDQEKIVEKFVEAFESISTWPRFNSDGSIPALWKSMNSHVEKMHSNITTLKETLHSKKEVSNFVITDRITKPDIPLDGIIEDIVIRLEEVNELHREESI